MPDIRMERRRREKGIRKKTRPHLVVPPEPERRGGWCGSKKICPITKKRSRGGGEKPVGGVRLPSKGEKGKGSSRQETVRHPAPIGNKAPGARATQRGQVGNPQRMGERGCRKKERPRDSFVTFSKKRQEGSVWGKNGRRGTRRRIPTVECVCVCAACSLRQGSRAGGRFLTKRFGDSHKAFFPPLEPISHPPRPPTPTCRICRCAWGPRRAFRLSRSCADNTQVGRG